VRVIANQLKCLNFAQSSRFVVSVHQNLLHCTGFVRFNRNKHAYAPKGTMAEVPQVPEVTMKDTIAPIINSCRRRAILHCETRASIRLQSRFGFAAEGCQTLIIILMIDVIIC